MTVPEGHFRIYPSMRPHLSAGRYRFRTTQPLEATARDGSERTSDDLPVDPLTTHVEVTSPRYQLPPEQILSTFPPAGSQGSYGSRLPQIAIKRRTLPWERDVVPGTTGPSPWMALVVIAEGEGELVLNAPVGQCVTPGVTLPGEPDVSTAHYLKVRRSVIDAVLPTQKDVPLLAHVREVDISDTELMMGDDDGFVALVVANRLPLAARNADGEETPVKYLAALINLEGQLDRLRPQAPASVNRTSDLIAAVHLTRPPAEVDLATITGGEPVINPGSILTDMTGLGQLTQPMEDQPRDAPRAATISSHSTHSVLASDVAAAAYSPAGGWPTDTILDGHSVALAMSKDFLISTVGNLADPVFRFPVLAHWSFTSAGDTTFESLMTNLDSGLLGTAPEGPPPSGRAPLTVVETGHVELPHRTRHGDLTSAWYRGPLSPHPTDTTSPRLPLAHAADQLRIVVPDGREDLSLASAFEIGRLLALSHPSLVDALMRWRQRHFQVARGHSILDSLLDLRLEHQAIATIRDLPHHLGLMLAGPLVERPEEIMGGPLELVRAGTDMRIAEQLSIPDSLPESLAQGLAVEADFTAAAGVTLGALTGQDVLRATDLSARELGTLVSGSLHAVLDARVSTFAASALGTEVIADWIIGEGTWQGIDIATIDTVLTGLGGVSIGEFSRSPGRLLGGPIIRPRDALDDLIEQSEQPEQSDGPTERAGETS